MRFQRLKAAIDPFAGKLDLIVSTGAILTTSLSLWIAKFFGPVCQVSMSGGTELCGSCKISTPQISICVFTD